MLGVCVPPRPDPWPKRAEFVRRWSRSALKPIGLQNKQTNKQKCAGQEMICRTFTHNPCILEKAAFGQRLISLSLGFFVVFFTTDSRVSALLPNPDKWPSELKFIPYLSIPFTNTSLCHVLARYVKSLAWLYNNNNDGDDDVDHDDDDDDINGRVLRRPFSNEP